jgi:hypothetical protein
MDRADGAGMTKPSEDELYVHLTVDDTRTAQAAGAEFIEPNGGGTGARLSQGRGDGDVTEPPPGKHRT